MDDEIHIWIAQQVADTKDTTDITPLFIKREEVAGTGSNTLISDGASNFKTPFNKELYTKKVATNQTHQPHMITRRP